jgi:hypothetical protein
MAIYEEAARRRWTLPCFCSENLTTTEAVLEAARLRGDQISQLIDDGVCKVNLWTALERDSSPALLRDMVSNAAKVGGASLAGEARILAITGAPIHSMYSISKILWLKRHEGETYGRAGFACVPHVVRGPYVTYAFTFTCGSLLKWFRDRFAQDRLAEARRRDLDVFDLLVEEAGGEPSPLLLLPHFAGVATPYMDSRAPARSSACRGPECFPPCSQAARVRARHGDAHEVPGAFREI